MADFLHFNSKTKSKTYTVDVTLSPNNLEFTVNSIKVDPMSLRQVADELEKIARIIRNDVVTGTVQVLPV